MTSATAERYDVLHCPRLAAVVACAGLVLLAFPSLSMVFGQEMPQTGDNVGMGPAHPQPRANRLGAVVEMSTRGVRIVSVDPAGAAAQAGIYRGDFILSVDGQYVRNPAMLHALIARVPLGGRAFIVVWRFGREVGVTVDFSLHSTTPVRRFGERMPQAWLGADLADSARGFVVLRVSPDGPCEQAGVRAGDIVLSLDDRRVTTVSEVVAIVQAAVPDSPVALLILRDGSESTRTVVLRERPFGPGPRRGVVWGDAAGGRGAGGTRALNRQRATQ